MQNILVMGISGNGEQFLQLYSKATFMIEMISPILRKFAFSNLIKQSKEMILPFTECPSDNTYGNDVSVAENTAATQTAVDLFSLFTADIIRKDVVFFR